MKDSNLGSVFGRMESDKPEAGQNRPSPLVDQMVEGFTNPDNVMRSLLAAALLGSTEFPFDDPNAPAVLMWVVMASAAGQGLDKDELMKFFNGSVREIEKFANSKHFADYQRRQGK